MSRASQSPIRHVSARASRAHLAPKVPTVARCEVCGTKVWSRKEGYLQAVPGLRAAFDAAANAYDYSHARCEAHWIPARPEDAR